MIQPPISQYGTVVLSGDLPCLSNTVRVRKIYLKSASFLAYGGKNNAHNLSMNILRDEGLPSMRFTFPVRKSIEGITSRKSVEVIALSSSLREIREVMLAVIFAVSSPETWHPANAGMLSLSQDTTF